MKQFKKIKNIFISTLLICLAVGFFVSCERTITRPASMRFSVQIFVADTTSEDSSQGVANASIVLQSITYGDRFDSITDSSGQAIFFGVLPDRYNVMASGKLVDGTDMTIVNGQLQDTMLYVENNDTLSLSIIPELSHTSALVISEIYYVGAPPKPITQYYHDQFTEIYNNSNQTIYLDSIIFCDAEYGYAEDSLIHAVHAYMFPGTGEDYPIEPGQIMVIAQDAIDHSPKPIYSINLLNADFEYFAPIGYNGEPTGDVNNQNVTDMVMLHHKYGVDFLYSVFSAGIVMLKAKDPYHWGYDEFNRILLPISGVIDGVEYRDNLTETNMKRLGPSIDGGLTGGIPSYSLQSVERIIDRYEDGQIILMDNNNSSLDFHVLSFPTPGVIEETEVTE